jgi:hypothetical protein
MKEILIELIQASQKPKRSNYGAWQHLDADVLIVANQTLNPLASGNFAKNVLF